MKKSRKSTISDSLFLSKLFVFPTDTMHADKETTLTVKSRPKLSLFHEKEKNFPTKWYTKMMTIG